MPVNKTPKKVLPTNTANPKPDNGVLLVGESFSGPLPPPSVLAEFEQVEPGAANRIISMTENQLRHNQEMEKLVVNSTVGDSRLGVWLAFILVIVVSVGGVIVAVLGHSVAGAVICISVIGGIVGTFIYGTRLSRQPRDGTH